MTCSRCGQSGLSCVYGAERFRDTSGNWVVVVAHGEELCRVCRDDSLRAAGRAPSLAELNRRASRK